MEKKLTAKQEMFCREYLVDFNATQAALRAGYSQKMAKQASRMLDEVGIQKLVALLRHERQERTKINADYVLVRLVEIDQMDVLDILNDDHSVKPVHAWPKIWRQLIPAMDVVEMKGEKGMQAFIKKVKLPDKVKNLELLGKHVNVGAFRERVSLGGDAGAPPVAIDVNLSPDDAYLKMIGKQ